MEGALTLVAGEPGIGKSTLLLQSAGRIAERGRKVLYLAGEESPSQVRLRAERLGVEHPGVLVSAGTAIDGLLEACRSTAADVVICDSIQTMYDPGLSSAPGSVSQVRAAADALQRFCKQTGTPAFLVGHVTKEGGIAGPKTLEHVVDVVLHFEGERHHETRVLRALKNRFGSIDEIAVFQMADRGLVAVANPSSLFVGSAEDRVPGSAHVASLHGTRPLIIEIQGLVSASPYATPQRVSAGFDGRRLALLLAVLEKKAGLRMGASDVFLNVVGGVTINEPAVDLAVVMALASSQTERPLRERTIVFGEVGLTGEVRPVRTFGPRLREAARLGFQRAVVAPDPGDDESREPLTAGITLEPVTTVREAVARALAE